VAPPSGGSENNLDLEVRAAALLPIDPAVTILDPAARHHGPPSHRGGDGHEFVGGEDGDVV
jgi:hypothetical protein